MLARMHEISELSYEMSDVIYDRDLLQTQPLLTKAEAVILLGGSIKAASKAIGITEQAISNWPRLLTPKLRDRVQAALWRDMVAMHERLRLQAQFERERTEARVESPKQSRITTTGDE